MEKFPSNWQRCATCVWWTGHREVDYFGNYVSVESRDKGRCMCRQGWYRQEREGSAQCSAHEKWKALG